MESGRRSQGGQGGVRGGSRTGSAGGATPSKRAFTVCVETSCCCCPGFSLGFPRIDAFHLQLPRSSRASTSAHLNGSSHLKVLQNKARLQDQTPKGQNFNLEQGRTCHQANRTWQLQLRMQDTSSAGGHPGGRGPAPRPPKKVHPPPLTPENFAPSLCRKSI